MCFELKSILLYISILALNQMLNDNRSTHYYYNIFCKIFSFLLYLIISINAFKELVDEQNFPENITKKNHCLVVKSQRSYRMVFETHEVIGVTLITVIYAFNILFIFHCHKNYLLCGRQVLKK